MPAARRHNHVPASNGKKTATTNSSSNEILIPFSALQDTIEQQVKSAVARIMPENYSANGGQTGMAGSATLGRKEKRLRRTSKEMPYGRSWNHIVARGVRRKREEMKLTVSEASQKVDLHNHTWDAVELGTRPNTTGANLGIILEFLFPKTPHYQALTQLLEIGNPLP